MSKKTAFIIIVAVLMIIAGLFYYYFYFTLQQQPLQIDTNTTNPNYFPFGNQSGNNTNSSNSTSNGTSNNISGISFIPTLRHITTVPVAGSSIVNLNNKIIIRYIERGTGHVFETSADSLSQNKITNTTIPKIYEAFWNKSGSELILRYLRDDSDTILSFDAKIKPIVTTSVSTTSLPSSNPSYSLASEITGGFLPTNIQTVSINPEKDQLFYTTISLNGASGFVSALDGTKKVQVFSSPLSEWLSLWPSTNTISLNTKPSGNSPGFLYFVNAQNGKLTKILGPIDGLTTLTNRDSSSVLYGVGGIIPSLGIYNIKNNSAKTISLQTLPDKCVWSVYEKTILY
ncbi:MAG: hypothetical protein WCO30_02260, partial [bacterium]